MKPYAKQNRSVIACTSCRHSKVRCIKDANALSCNRCEEFGIQCHYEMKKSQQAGLIKKRIISTILPERAMLSSVENLQAEPIFPPKHILMEVMEIFFTNQYQGIFPFLHKPSVFRFLKSDEFEPSTYIQDYTSSGLAKSYASNVSRPDPVLLLSVLALCSRLHRRISVVYGKFREEDMPDAFQPDITAWESALDDESIDLASASNALKYFGWHARQRMRDVFDSPTVQRIQAFTLLSSHEWGESNNSRSFLYIGIAARMALVLGLGKEQETDKNIDENTRQIVVESKRRTIWSVYMMDRCNSSGRQRSPAIRIEDIHIRLPCIENDFLFGNVNLSLTYRQLKSQFGKSADTNMSLVGYTIVLFEIWAKIAKWVGEVGVKHEITSPWDSESNFQKLNRSLDEIINILPLNYYLSDFNLNMHVGLKTATHFGYFHGLLLLCRIFLTREYLFCNPKSFPEGWWKNLTLQLLSSLERFSFMLETLKANDMIVIAPFTGFEIFTCAVTSFYFCAFPNEILLAHLPTEHYGVEGTVSEVEEWKFKYKKLALKNLDLLTGWSDAWELGRKWQKLAVSLGVLFGQYAQTGSNEINSDCLRHSMQDYGSSDVPEVYSSSKRSSIQESSEIEVMRLLNKDLVGSDPSEASKIEQLSLPALPFSDSPSIYPGWNDDDVLDFILQK